MYIKTALGHHFYLMGVKEFMTAYLYRLHIPFTKKYLVISKVRGTVYAETSVDEYEF